MVNTPTYYITKLITAVKKLYDTGSDVPKGQWFLIVRDANIARSATIASHRFFATFQG
jgi:hypothetical protein